MLDGLRSRSAGANERLAGCLRLGCPWLDRPQRDQEVVLGGGHVPSLKRSSPAFRFGQKADGLQVQSPADRLLGCLGPSIGEQRRGQERVGGRVRRMGRDRGVEGYRSPRRGVRVTSVGDRAARSSRVVGGICHSASTRTMATAGVAAPDGASVGQCIDRPKRHQAAMPTGAMIVVPTLTRTITA